MISVDTNLLLAAAEIRNSNHERAGAFMESLGQRSDVVLSELALLEFYGLLRNAAVVPRPLSNASAVALINGLRSNPNWTIVALPPDTRRFHDSLWAKLSESNIARRRAYDIRLALSLRGFGVDEFATANVRDFENLGFRRVWNPLATATD